MREGDERLGSLIAISDELRTQGNSLKALLPSLHVSVCVCVCVCV